MSIFALNTKASKPASCLTPGCPQSDSEGYHISEKVERLLRPGVYVNSAGLEYLSRFEPSGGDTTVTDAQRNQRTADHAQDALRGGWMAQNYSRSSLCGQNV